MTNCLEYAFVVDSDDALADWANNTGNTSGTKYTSVLIKPGEWSLTTNKQYAINLTTSQTKVVVGELGSKIKIVTTYPSVSSNFDTPSIGIGYTESPADLDYYMDGVSLEINCSLNNSWICAFKNCINLTRCYGFGRGTDSTKNCSCTSFAKCKNLQACNGLCFSTGSFGAAGFFYCDFMTHCTIESRGNGGNYACYYCTKLAFCHSTASGGKYNYAYSWCDGLIACVGAANTESQKAAAFKICENLCDCTGMASAKNQACGFESCSYLENCDGTGTYTSGNATDYSNYGYGFKGCSGISFCFKTFVSTSATFHDCYSSNRSYGTYQSANYSAPGGFNIA